MKNSSFSYSLQLNEISPSFPMQMLLVYKGEFAGQNDFLTYHLILNSNLQILNSSLQMFPSTSFVFLLWGI